MMKLDPIIAVKDVEASSFWYQQVFGLKSKHGGSEFEILVSEQDEVVLCLHPWGANEHPTMDDPNVTSGNGLILYFRTDRMDEMYENEQKIGVKIEEDVH